MKTGLEREIVSTRERLSALTMEAAKLQAQSGRRGIAPATAGAAVGKAVAPVRRRCRMSAEVRKRIPEMMKARLAERRKPKK